MASWRITLPCTRAEAQALSEDIAPFAMLDAPPVLVTSEAEGERWRLDAYFEDQPDAALLERLAALVPSAAGATAKPERVADEDWVTLSQQGLEPIEAGRFFVHTPAHRHRVPPDAIAFEIDAGLAFGTGQHETTSGCLLALDRLKRGGASFSAIADIGTGTGLLAFAAMRLWPMARATASDIDPVAIEVAAENAAINRIPLGRARGKLELAVATGMDHPRLKARAPYDLILANILAGPLVELAPALTGALAPDGRLVLAGLLEQQAARVLAAYRRQGLISAFSLQRDDWPTLVMRKRRRSLLPKRYRRR
jgi:ribosomal protein L11 methyltransferase